MVSLSPDPLPLTPLPGTLLGVAFLLALVEAVLTAPTRASNIEIARRGSSEVEQRTENPRVGSSILPLGT